jgi:hypothetical protein
MTDEITHTVADEDTTTLADTETDAASTVWNLRSRQVERNETDPDRRCHPVDGWPRPRPLDPSIRAEIHAALTDPPLAVADPQASFRQQADRHFWTEIRNEYGDNAKRLSRMADPPTEELRPIGPPVYHPEAPPAERTESPSDNAMRAMNDLVNLLQQGYPTRVTSGRSVVSDSVIAPKPFFGTAADLEEAETWVDYFHRYISYRGLAEEDKLRLFSILLRGPAAQWLSTLPPEVTHSYPALLEQFKTSYFKSPELRWADASNVFKQIQKAGERVDDFVTRVRHAARRLNITNDMLHYAIIQGLTPHIRTHVLSQGVKTLDDTIKAARVAECSLSVDPVTSLLMQSIESNKRTADEQNKTITALADRIQALTPGHSHGGEIPVTPLPNQIVQTVNQPLADRAQPNQFRPMGNDRRRNFRQTPQRRQRENQSRQNWDSRPSGAGMQSRQVRPPAGQTPNTTCSRCAGSHGWGECPAIGKNCRICNRPNHFARACRAVRQN